MALCLGCREWNYLDRGSVKAATCSICQKEYAKQRMGQVVCSPKCAIKVPKVTIQKEKALVTQRKEALKTKRDYMKEAQVAFNAYIRERDKHELCICCNQFLSSGDVGGAYDCGHYRSVGSAPHLRFDERNAHGQRKFCNRWGYGRAVDYRIGLIRRIGKEAVEALEADQSPKNYTKDDLIQIRALYKQKLNDLKGGYRNGNDN